MEEGGSRPSLHSRHTTAVFVIAANREVFAGSQVRLLCTQSSGPETLWMVGGTANLQIVDLQAGGKQGGDHDHIPYSGRSGSGIFALL
jgi:hypothetical protein